MLWVMCGFMIVAAWAVLSVVGGERQRLLQEMRMRVAAQPAVAASAVPASQPAATSFARTPGKAPAKAAGGPAAKPPAATKNAARR